MITGVAGMVLLLLIFLYYKVNGRENKRCVSDSLFGIAVLGTWF
jgi:hypothetical protein